MIRGKPMHPEIDPEPTRRTQRSTVYERNLAIEERKAKAMERIGVSISELAGVVLLMVIVLAGLVVAVWRMG